MRILGPRVPCRLGQQCLLRFRTTQCPEAANRPSSTSSDCLLGRIQRQPSCWRFPGFARLIENEKCYDQAGQEGLEKPEKMCSIVATVSTSGTKKDEVSPVFGLSARSHWADFRTGVATAALRLRNYSGAITPGRAWSACRGRWKASYPKRRPQPSCFPLPRGGPVPTVPARPG